MAFKNLEERFNATVNDLYAGATTKFAGGRASNRTNDDPLMVVGPGENRRGIQQEGRSLPFVSAPRDVVRLTRFSLSPKGILFLAKQQLLQTGNTFAQTKLINPAFVVANAVPFLHVRRHLRPVTGKFGIAATRDSVRANARLLGQLQPATLDTIKAKYELRGNVGNPGIRDRLKSGLKSLAQPFEDTISAFRAVRDVGEKFERSAAPSIWPSGFGKDVPEDKGWDKSRPEIGTITTETDDQIAEYHQETDKFFKEFGGGVPGRRVIGPPTNPLVSFPQQSQPFLKYFTGANESIKSTTQARGGSLNARDLAVPPSGSLKRRISYIRDPLNEKPRVSSENLLLRYNDLPSVGEFSETPQTDGQGNKIDPVLISFAMGKDHHVQFRAFIRDINHAANPEYKTYQYIGRIEKFISYVSVQREVNFKLDIIAMSKDELDIVWNRINYLTSFVFPYGINKGILQPNIIRMTIGNMFRDQPVYVTSLSTVFNEISESWDIDREVPIAATTNIGFNIIEKRTMTANNAFYAINEKRLATGFAGAVSLPFGFSEQTGQEFQGIPDATTPPSGG